MKPFLKKSFQRYNVVGVSTALELASDCLRWVLIGADLLTDTERLGTTASSGTEIQYDLCPSLQSAKQSVIIIGMNCYWICLSPNTRVLMGIQDQPVSLCLLP